VGTAAVLLLSVDTVQSDASTSARPTSEADKSAVYILSARPAYRLHSCVSGVSGAGGGVGYVQQQHTSIWPSTPFYRCVALLQAAQSLSTWYKLPFAVLVAPADHERKLAVSNTDFADLWRRAVQHNPFVQAFMLNFGAIGVARMRHVLLQMYPQQCSAALCNPGSEWARHGRQTHAAPQAAARHSACCLFERSIFVYQGRGLQHHCASHCRMAKCSFCQ